MATTQAPFSLAPFSSPRHTTNRLKGFVTNNLSREERLVIMLRYAEDLSDAEIGIVLGLPAAEVAEIHDGVVARVKTQLVPASRSNPLVA